MRLIRPATIDDAALTSSSATESVAAYNAGTTYALGAQVRDDTTHRIFESAQASNTGHALTDPAWWFDVGPANKWAMFDTVIGTSTVGAAELDVTVSPAGRVDSVALLNLDAASVHVVVSIGGDDVYDETYSLVAESGVADWYSWFFEPIVRSNILVVSDIPLTAEPDVQVVLSAGGEPVSVGAMIVGQAKTIGSTEAGGSIGIVDYSRKEADEFGNYRLVERAYSRKGSFRVLIPASDVDEIDRLLAGYRATPIVYIASDSYAATVIFGFYRDFNIEIAYPTAALCSLELEGLT